MEKFASYLLTFKKEVAYVRNLFLYHSAKYSVKIPANIASNSFLMMTVY